MVFGKLIIVICLEFGAWDLIFPQFCFAKLRWWAKVESNHRPYPYQGYALTS